MEIVFGPDGNAHCVYAELVPLHFIGSIDIERASHVEPDSEGNWLADLGPVDGPLHGPFPRRTDALGAEVAWLQNIWLLNNHNRSS